MTKLVKVLLFTILCCIPFLIPKTALSQRVEQDLKVARLDEVPRLTLLPGQSVSYKISSCPGTNDGCIVTASARLQRPSLITNGLVTPLSSSATIICRWQITNVFGLVLAAVENQQATTFFNQHGKSPFAWNSFPTAVYQSSPSYTWSNKISTINPAAGYQSTSGESTVSGQLNFLGASQGNRRAMIYFSGSGTPWRCLAG